MSNKKFVFLCDLHYGFERKNGHKVPLHDEKAMELALQFTNDYQPDVIILGGDILDCGAISHHNKSKPGRTEGLRIVSDARECFNDFISPLNVKVAPGAKKYYIKGNHEAWLQDLQEEIPGIEGLLDVKQLLQLDSSWNIIDQGDHINLGKLTFIHGDQLSGGEHVAKAAVIAYERSVRFGHFHSTQLYSKNTPIDNVYPKTGMSVGCLCKKAPHYGKGKPNRWNQGFLYGYILSDGSYFDYPVTIIKGQSIIDGKHYAV